MTQQITLESLKRAGIDRDRAESILHDVEQRNKRPILFRHCLPGGGVQRRYSSEFNYTHVVLAKERGHDRPDGSDPHWYIAHWATSWLDALKHMRKISRYPWIKASMVETVNHGNPRYT